MFKRPIAVIAVLGLAVSTPVAIASSRPSGTHRATIRRPARPKETWELNFAEGRDTITHNSQVEDRGHYTVSGSTLTFKPRTCRVPGKYELHLTRNTLRLTEISDPCPSPSVRLEILTHTFAKVR